MFSKEEKIKISKAVEDVLLEINHPEMTNERPEFNLHIKGKEDWSWADIEPNWHYEIKPPETSEWNEKSREILSNINTH